MSTTTAPVRRGGVSPVLVAASIGAIWGFLGYAVLWGYTPLFPSRAFVLGRLGTILFAPVRAVLWGIHVVEERSASAPFDFSANNGWIGLLAALVGAAMLALVVAAVRVVLRWRGRSGGDVAVVERQHRDDGEQHAEPGQDQDVARLEPGP